MRVFKKKEGYVTKGNRKIAEGRTAEATQIVIDGLNDYQNRIISSLNGYPADDAALIIIALRKMADNLESNNPQSAGLLKWLNENVTPPKFQNTTKVEKTKKR